MNNIDVSVIVPIYNVEEYLKDCIESLVHQTYHNIEIILVDDGSTDCCPKICDEYLNVDSRVKVIHQKNKGLPGARNSGLKIANGDWVLFLDSDDWLVENAIEQLLNCSRNDIDIIIFKKQKVHKYINTKQASGTGQIIELTEDDVACLLDDAFDPMFKTFKKCKLDVVSAWSKFYRKSFLNSNGLLFFEEVKIHEDIPFAITVYDAKPRILFLDYCLYMYRFNAASITNSFRAQYTEETIRIIERLENIECHNIDTREWKRMFYDRVMVCTVNLMIRCFCHPFNKKSYSDRKSDFLRWLNLDYVCRAMKEINIDLYEWKKKIVVFLIMNRYFRILDIFFKLQFAVKYIKNKFWC